MPTRFTRKEKKQELTDTKLIWILNYLSLKMSSTHSSELQYIQFYLNAAWNTCITKNGLVITELRPRGDNTCDKLAKSVWKHCASDEWERSLL